MKVLVTNVAASGEKFREDPPMGLIYLGTGLTRAGHEVRCNDAQENHADPFGLVRDWEPDAVLISVTTEARFSAFDLSRRVKALLPKTVIVVGGPHFISGGEQTLRVVPEVDFVVRGYAESRIVSLLDGAPPALIPGVTHREDGRVVENVFDGKPDPRDFILPDYELLPLDRYEMLTDGKPSLPLFTSRGCCNKCTFCAAGHLSRKVVFADVDLARENIERIARLGYTALRIQDDTFGMRRDDAFAIMDELARRKMTYSIKSRIEILDEEFLDALKKTGCYGIKFGVESVVPKVLKEMNKKLDLDKLERVIAYGAGLDLMLGAFLMIGTPSETFDDAMRTVEFGGNLPKRGALPLMTIGCYIFPGTTLESKAMEEGRIPKGFDWAQPYDEPRNLELGYHSQVPVYTSKDLGFDEMLNLRAEFRKRAFILDHMVDF